MIPTIILTVFFIALVVLVVGGALNMSSQADDEIQRLQDKDSHDRH